MRIPRPSRFTYTSAPVQAGLEVLTEDAAPAARHALYYLCVLALLVLALKT
jgi:hypothetical protein